MSANGETLSSESAEKMRPQVSAEMSDTVGRLELLELELVDLADSIALAGMVRNRSNALVTMEAGRLVRISRESGLTEEMLTDAAFLAGEANSSPARREARVAALLSLVDSMAPNEPLLRVWDESYSGGIYTGRLRLGREIRSFEDRTVTKDPSRLHLTVGLEHEPLRISLLNLLDDEGLPTQEIISGKEKIIKYVQRLSISAKELLETRDQDIYRFNHELFCLSELLSALYRCRIDLVDCGVEEEDRSKLVGLLAQSYSGAYVAHERCLAATCGVDRTNSNQHLLALSDRLRRRVESEFNLSSEGELISGIEEFLAGKEQD